MQIHPAVVVHKKQILLIVAPQSHAHFLDAARPSVDGFTSFQCRIRTGYAAENMATIRKMAIDVIRGSKSKKGGGKAKRLQAAWNDNYLRERLMAM